ncbi:MAG: inorganic diphosphatase [Verrucomicrobiota bacterium]
MHSKTSFQILIETPRGSNGKLKYEPKLQLFTLHHVLSKGFEFPYDFGFIPSTLGEDGDPLDVLVLCDAKVYPGCLVNIRLIGVLEAEQTLHGEKQRNDRLIAIEENSPTWKKIKQLRDLPEILVDEIENFFISYNKVRSVKFKLIGKSGVEAAEKAVEKGLRRFEKKKKSKSK